MGGGILYIAKKHSKSNNKYMKLYHAKFVTYLDAIIYVVGQFFSINQIVDLNG